MSLKLEKLQALNLAMLVAAATTKNREKFDTNKRYLNAKYAAIELHEAAKDYVDTKTEAEKKRDEFVKPYRQIREDLEKSLNDETSEEKRKEVEEAIEMNEKELVAKFEEAFKETSEKLVEMSKEEVAVIMNSDKFDVMKDVFNKYGNEAFPIGNPGADGRPQMVSFADDVLLQSDKALEAAVKVE